MRRRAVIASVLGGALATAGAMLVAPPRAAAQDGRPELPPPPVVEEPAGDGGVNDEVWPEIDVVWVRSPARRVIAMASVARGRETRHTELHVGLHAERRWPRGTSARAGLEAVRSMSDDSHRELRAAVDVTPRWPIGRGWMLVDRNRVDLRLIEEAFSARLRIRPRLERTRKFAAGDELTSYLFVEAFHDTRYDVVVSRALLQLGVDWRFTRAASIEFAVGRQWDTRADAQRVNALSITTTIYP